MLQHPLRRCDDEYYRLTLVKGWNVEELDVYSELIKLGKPDFIEVKGGFFKD